MPDARTIGDLSRQGGHAAALGAPGRSPMTYDALRRQTSETVARLNQLGIGRNDPVAIVLPNGPEMASAFIGVAAGATTAPLNPAYREEEYDFYLSDLGARLLLVEANSGNTPARAAARKLGIAVAELKPISDGPAGAFELTGARSARTPCGRCVLTRSRGRGR